MSKQRYVRYELVNKEGNVETTGYEIAGSIYPFAGKDSLCLHNIQSTKEFIDAYCSVNSKPWLAAFKRQYKVRKAIVFIG